MHYKLILLGLMTFRGDKFGCYYAMILRKFKVLNSVGMGNMFEGRLALGVLSGNCVLTVAQTRIARAMCYLKVVRVM